MSRIFITGSAADGFGRMAAELLIEQGHRVVLHARNQARADEIGDLATIAETRNVAEQVNALGTFDAIIHNAAVGYKEPKRIETEDGLSMADRDAVRFLRDCEADGMKLENCPLYVREWMDREKD